MTDYPRRLFVTGIGTDVGKSWATGWLAREIAENTGHSVITQKFIQTGCIGSSEDIEVHRHIMGIEMTERDLDHTTAPIILSYPASPLLASRIDNVNIDWETPARSLDTLSREYEHVLVEGAGGALVPLTADMLTADWIAAHNLQAAIVTGGHLGSISLTLLTIEALRSRGVEIAMLIYNPHFDSDKTISVDTRAYLRSYLERHLPTTQWIEMPQEVMPH